MPAKRTTSKSRGWGPGRGERGDVRGASAEGAVVVTVTVTLVPALAGLGETVHVASEGAPVQAKDTVLDNPPKLPTLNV